MTRSLDTRSAQRQNAVVADRVHQHGIGALAAQKAIAAIRGGADASLAFDRLLELADAHGMNSTACAAFVRELAKRIA